MGICMYIITYIGIYTTYPYEQNTNIYIHIYHIYIYIILHTISNPLGCHFHHFFLVSKAVAAVAAESSQKAEEVPIEDLELRKRLVPWTMTSIHPK